MVTAKDPGIADETWLEVHSALANFKKSKPWLSVTDSDLFGIICPRSGQLGFGCIMGSAGICQGLFVYRGYRGYQSFVAIQNGMEVESAEDYYMMQDGILVEFTAREYTDSADRKLFKRLGLTFRGKKAWPMVRSLRPGYIPWHINEEEAQLLLSVLEATPHFYTAVRKDPEFAHGKDGDYLPVYRKDQQEWKYDWYKKTHFLTPDPDEPVQPIMDEVAVARLAKRNLPHRDSWEIGCFSSPEPVSDGDRPYFPFACAILSSEMGTALGVELTSPDVDPIHFIQSRIIAAAESLGSLPQVLKVDNPILADEILPFAHKLGMEAEVSDLKQFEEFHSGLHQHLDSD